MERKQTLLFSLLLVSSGVLNIHAQEATLAGGGDATGIGSASFSIGQAFYMTYTCVDGSVAQGMQHPYEISTALGLDDYEAITLEFQVYPNPTMNQLTLDLKDFSVAGLDFVLYDAGGKLLDQRALVQNKTSIEMAYLPPATYFLKVSDGKKIIKTFKIIKN